MKKIITWMCNVAVALLSILAIAGYFFSPFWSINLGYTLSGEDLETMIGEYAQDFDVKEVVGKDGLELTLSLEIGTDLILGSFGAESERTVELLVGENTDNIVGQLTETLKDLAPKAAKSVAKKAVREEVRDKVGKYLDSLDSHSDKSVDDRLKDAGVDEIIEEKIDSIVETLFQGEPVQKEEVRKEILGAVDDVYEQLQKSGDEDLADLELSEEDREAIEEAIDEMLDQFADESGEIDLDEFLNELLAKGLDALGGQGGSGLVDGIALLAAEEGADSNATDQLKDAVKDYIMSLLPAQINIYIVWALRVMLFLWILSLLAWVYILIKLIVKLLKGSNNPTVKLKAPIILGWIPFLLLVILPTIGMMLFKGPISGVLPAEITARLASASISFASSGWFAFLAALVCIVLSGFYSIMRKQIEKEAKTTD